MPLDGAELATVCADAPTRITNVAVSIRAVVCANRHDIRMLRVKDGTR